jgi:hypothetical protein
VVVRSGGGNTRWMRNGGAPSVPGLELQGKFPWSDLRWLCLAMTVIYHQVLVEDIAWRLFRPILQGENIRSDFY